MVNKKRGTTQFDPKMEEPPSDKSKTMDLNADAVSPIKSLENQPQEANPLVYRDDPNFQDLLLHFQNAEWEECLKKIDQLLGIYPDDKYLSAFKQDVEVRLKQQESSLRQQAEESREKRQKWVVRTITIFALSLILIFFLIWAGNAYQTTRTQNRLEQEATLTVQSLAAKSQVADSFMRAGKPKEALRLYMEIQQMDPSYQDIDQKIQLARQSVAIEELYQQGTQAIKDGQSDKALEILLQVDELHPKYKDAPQLIEQLKQEQQIASLVAEIHDSYIRGDWLAVIHAYETIHAISPLIQIPEVDEELFISYRNLIFDIAGRADATLEDIEKAEIYYRNALALFPQSQEHAAERAELHDVISDLLAHKYYLFGISLLESSNYSIRDVPEAIRILTKANNIGSGSPVIQEEIEKTLLFLDSYNNFMKRNWDDAIAGFEKISRNDENYAGGRLKYMLYEAYIARGDLLFKYADFTGASADYQEAEKIAWSNEGNLLRLFQVEVRIAATLNKLQQVKEAVGFYHYAFEQLGFKNQLTRPEQQDLLSILNQADQAYKAGKAWEAIQLYQTALEQKKNLYTYTTVSVKQGDTFVDIAFRYGCTFESLTMVNQLGETMTIVRDQEILVPIVPTND